MKNLQTLHQKLPKNAVLSKEELLNTVGGRRYETRSHSRVVSLCQQLWYYGYRYTISQHNGKYCIEW